MPSIKTEEVSKNAHTEIERIKNDYLAAYRERWGEAGQLRTSPKTRNLKPRTRRLKMAHPVRKTYWVMITTWSGLRRRVLSIRTALVMELDGHQARRIARALGGHYLRAA